MKNNELRNDFRKLLTAMTLDYPVYALLLRRLRVVYKDNEHIAATNKKEIILGREFFKLTAQQQFAVLAHEALHNILAHPERFKKLVEKLGINPLVLNLIADAKINTSLQQDGFQLPNPTMPQHVQKILGIPEDVLLKESLEELALRLVKQQKQQGKQQLQQFQADVQLEGSGEQQQQGESQQEQQKQGKQGSQGEQEEQKKQKEQGKGSKGEQQEKGEEQKQGSGKQGEQQKEKRTEIVLNEGDRELQKAKGEDLKQVKQQILLETIFSAKAVGKSPLGLQRLVEELEKPKVHWKRLLRNALEKGLGNDVKKTWSRLSRKSNMLPMKELIGLRNALVLVDTSGSIGEAQLRKMLSEIYGILKTRRVKQVTVIPWDAKVYSPIVLKTPSDIKKVKTHLKGGGGTVITPAVKRALQLSRKGDIFVILSDFYTSEDDTELRKLFSELSRKGKVVLISVQGKHIRFPKCISTHIRYINFPYELPRRIRYDGKWIELIAQGKIVFFLSTELRDAKRLALQIAKRQEDAIASMLAIESDIKRFAKEHPIIAKRLLKLYTYLKLLSGDK